MSTSPGAIAVSWCCWRRKASIHSPAGPGRHAGLAPSCARWPRGSFMRPSSRGPNLRRGRPPLACYFCSPGDCPGLRPRAAAASGPGLLGRDVTGAPTPWSGHSGRRRMAEGPSSAVVCQRMVRAGRGENQRLLPPSRAVAGEPCPLPIERASWPYPSSSVRPRTIAGCPRRHHEDQFDGPLIKSTISLPDC